MNNGEVMQFQVLSPTPRAPFSFLSPLWQAGHAADDKEVDGWRVLPDK
jgi:hypothetical protein